METITLASAGWRATIAPGAGGRIAQVEALAGGGWHPLLIDPPISDGDPFGWGCFAMIPWPNRIAGGQFAFDGTTYALPAHRDGHALHGVGAARAWTVEDVAPASCALSLDLGDVGWPFGGIAILRYAIADGAFALGIEIRATGAAFPAGAGWHPWFRREIAGAGARVRIDAATCYELDAMIPTGRILPLDAARDLRDAPPLGGRRLDDCYRDVRGPISIHWGGLALEMRQTVGVAHAVVYSPPGALCVEPQTCAIDAFNLAARGIDAGVQVVAPGAPLIARTTWRATSDAPLRARGRGADD